MELWACGLNAWGQLDFEKEDQSGEPHDIFELRCVLKAEKIKSISSSISGTLVSTPLSPESIRVAGLLDGLQELIVEDSLQIPESIVQAGNSKIAAYANGSIIEYLNLETYPDGGQVLLGIEKLEAENVKQLSASQTSFFALTTGGTVWSWGDERYGYCLGRETDPSKPAFSPSLVEQLTELPGGPVVKVASGGYLTAALTFDNDLYIWGGRPGEASVIPDVRGQEPTPLDIYNHDILDFGIGDRHMIVLTTDLKVFVIGEGGNGQLGSLDSMSTKWIEITPPLPQQQNIVSVAAGPRNSFVLVSAANLRSISPPVPYDTARHNSQRRSSTQS